MRSGCWLLVVLALGCSPAVAPAPPSAPSVEVPAAPDEPVASTPPTRSTLSSGDAIRATLRIDQKPGGKKFQGVWLERENGEKWLISYRPEELWRGFENKSVGVRGAIYQPRGQAIRATHFRVDWLAIAGDDNSTDLVEVKEERIYQGQFEEFSWPAGTKLEGEKTPVFSSNGQQYFLANRVERMPFGQKLAVRAREVVPSSHVARPGGPFLWVLDP